jgi:hypothetical protein
MRSLSEAETHSRGRPALERGGTPLEGATSPRARRRFAGAAPRPSSEAEFRRGWLGRLSRGQLGATWAVGP